MACRSDRYKSGASGPAIHSSYTTTQDVTDMLGYEVIGPPGGGRVHKPHVGARRRLKRGTFRWLVDLQAAIHRYIAKHQYQRH